MWGGQALLAPQATAPRTMTSAFLAGPWEFTRWKGGEAAGGYSLGPFIGLFPPLVLSGRWIGQ